MSWQRTLGIASLLVVGSAGCSGCADRDASTTCSGAGRGGADGAGGSNGGGAGVFTAGGMGGAAGVAAASEADARATELLGALTLDEKLALVAGTGFDTVGVPRLGIPALHMSDGPVGVRTEQSTAWPASIAMAATFDPALAERYGGALGREAKAHGKNVVLGPCVNILRAPQGGRSFEAFGEDPYLAARMAVGVVRGIQAEGVVATVKHFAANNQETERFTIDAVVGPRALHEIYFPTFEAAVKEAHAQAVMCAYNRLNGAYACESPYLLNQILKERWGFTGLVMSDWGATHSVAPTIRAGLDLEMPTGVYLSPANLRAGLDSGEFTIAEIDEMVRRQLRVIAEMGYLDRPLDAGALDTPEHRALNREAARSSFVLLKNQGGGLPLDPEGIQRLAVLGPLATSVEAGGGSSLVAPTYEVTFVDALRARLPDVSIDETVGAAATADAAIVFVGDTDFEESEGFDRASLELSAEQLALIHDVAAVNPHTIVLVGTGTSVLLGDFLGEASAVVQTWFGGQELGNALVDVLFGDFGPSGRLPVTIPRRWEDCPAFGSFPGANGIVEYEEGILVGYRGFDTHAVVPEFPFGYGLSYTTFEYGGLEVGAFSPANGVAVSFDVANVGSRAGVTVAELYLHDVASSLERPEQELAGFVRAELEPGETRRLELTIQPRAFAFFEPAQDDWVREAGSFEIRVGESSRDIRLRQELTLE